MNRRRFLRAKSEQLVGTTATLLIPEPPIETSGQDLTLIRVSRRAMATRFEIALPYGTPNALAAAEDALDLIDELEDQLTVYRSHSELSRINQTASGGPVEIESRLFGLLQQAAVLTQDSAGAFDLATGALIRAWGFLQREGRVPTPANLKSARACSGMKHVILNAENQTIKFRKPGLELNLGGVGKGYALDRAAELLQSRWGISSALLHAGGSSVFALGSPSATERGWTIAIKHPWDLNRSLGSVRLKDQGFGTSAATFQYFEYKGQKLGHLLDPRTGWPAKGSASASCIATSAATADALSTAFFVLGAKATQEFCHSRPWLGAIVLPEDTPEEAPIVVGFAPNHYDLPTEGMFPFPSSILPEF